jgi:hypothetical protein
MMMEQLIYNSMQAMMIDLLLPLHHRRRDHRLRNLN